MCFDRKTWLQFTGSPKSCIDQCNFTDERDIQKLEYDDFTIVREDTRMPKKVTGTREKPSKTQKLPSVAERKHRTKKNT